MPTTEEVRFYCDRCGSLYATSGENGEMPPRDQVRLTISTVADGGSSRDAEPSYHDGYSDIKIGSPNRYAQVCPSCFSEFCVAEERLLEWWKSGAKQVTGRRSPLLANTEVRAQIVSGKRS